MFIVGYGYVGGWRVEEDVNKRTDGGFKLPFCACGQNTADVMTTAPGAQYASAP